jgi:hypothetical protein
MFQYIHDPEFEADYVDYAGEEYIPEEDIYLSERLATLEDQYIQLLDKTPDQVDTNYMYCLLNSMWQFVDEMNFEDHPFFKREAIHIFFKTVNTPVGQRYLRQDLHFLRLCKLSAEDIMSLELVTSDDLRETDEDGLWDNTKSVIHEFLQEAATILTNLCLN